MCSVISGSWHNIAVTVKVLGSNPSRGSQSGLFIFAIIAIILFFFSFRTCLRLCFFRYFCFPLSTLVGT